MNAGRPTVAEKADYWYVDKTRGVRVSFAPKADEAVITFAVPAMADAPPPWPGSFGRLQCGRSAEASTYDVDSPPAAQQVDADLFVRWSYELFHLAVRRPVPPAIAFCTALRAGRPPAHPAR